MICKTIRCDKAHRVMYLKTVRVASKCNYLGGIVLQIPCRRRKGCQIREVVSRRREEVQCPSRSF